MRTHSKRLNILQLISIWSNGYNAEPLRIQLDSSLSSLKSPSKKNDHLQMNECDIFIANKNSKKKFEPKSNAKKNR